MCVFKHNVIIKDVAVINLLFVVNETFNKFINRWYHTGCKVLLHPEWGP